MAEKVLSTPQHRTDEGALVIPLDHPRSFDYANEAIAAGGAHSGAMYTPCSGKVPYIKHMIVTELSGTDGGHIWLQDNSGHICPPIPVAANTCVTWDPRPAACGPTHGTIYWETNANGFYGEMTLIVQVDPQVIE